MRKNKKRSNDDAQIDVTPMLDIVFIMLIFFIVSSTFIRESGLDVTEHQNDENQDQQENNTKAIFVQVCNNGDIKVDNRSIDVDSVRANIERKLAESSNTAVIVETEQKSPTHSLVSVIDQARAAKANVSISPIATLCKQPSSEVALQF